MHGRIKQCTWGSVVAMFDLQAVFCGDKPSALELKRTGRGGRSGITPEDSKEKEGRKGKSRSTPGTSRIVLACTTSSIRRTPYAGGLALACGNCRWVGR